MPFYSGDVGPWTINDLVVAAVRRPPIDAGDNIGEPRTRYRVGPEIADQNAVAVLRWRRRKLGRGSRDQPILGAVEQDDPIIIGVAVRLPCATGAKRSGRVRIGRGDADRKSTRLNSSHYCAAR